MSEVGGNRVVKKRGIGSHTRPNGGATNDWITPRSIIDAIGPFDLDPCACAVQPWPTARRMVAPPNDGLAEQWFGRVWLNPPYGKEAAIWLERMADHGSGTALLFARTETEMFHRFVWPRARALLFFEGRLHFHYPDGSRAKGNAGGPSVLIAYGDYDALVLGRNRRIEGAFMDIKGDCTE